MGSEFTFYDYVNASGENKIRSWLDGQTVKVRAKFDTWLRNLEATPIGLWGEPYVSQLHGECNQLFEIKPEVQGVQYRLLGFHGPARDPTLVFGAREVGGKWQPPSTCNQAQKRRAIVEVDSPRRRRKHEFG